MQLYNTLPRVDTITRSFLSEETVTAISWIELPYIILCTKSIVCTQFHALVLSVCSEQCYMENVRETRQLENDIADLEQQHADLTLGSVNTLPMFSFETALVLQIGPHHPETIAA